MEKYINIIKEYSKNTYKQMTREPAGYLKHPFIVPGSSRYSNCLWDWDSWLTDVAVRQIMYDNNDIDDEFLKCEKGCVVNFLENIFPTGRILIAIAPDFCEDVNSESNCHKPCLAQHIAFIVKAENGDASWIEPYFCDLEKFIKYYLENCYHEKTGLFFWLDDGAIGVDNDPCTFYRPNRSSASIYLNCLMYKELCAMEYICNALKKNSSEYREHAEKLKDSIRTHLWDERNGFYYSADLNLKPIDPAERRHSGAPRHWDCLIQRIDVWSGFMAMWAGIASKEEAERMVCENMLNEKTFWAEYGIRTLSKLEKMYVIKKSGNPSCWLGPVWGVSNWMCFEALVKYGFDKEATALAEKTITLFGKDITTCGEMHEYYNPDEFDGVNNQGFQNWNLLVNNMIAWIEKRPVVWEF